MSDTLASLMAKKVNKHSALASRVADMMNNLSGSLDFMIKEVKVTAIQGRPTENKLYYHVVITHDGPLNRRGHDIASILAFEWAEQILLPISGNVTSIERSVWIDIKEENAS